MWESIRRLSSRASTASPRHPQSERDPERAQRDEGFPIASRDLHFAVRDRCRRDFTRSTRTTARGRGEPLSGSGRVHPRTAPLHPQLPNSLKGEGERPLHPRGANPVSSGKIREDPGRCRCQGTSNVQRRSANPGCCPRPPRETPSATKRPGLHRSAARGRAEYPHSMIKSGLVRRVGAALFLAACSKSAPPAAAPPPPEVRVVVVATQPIANAIELPGRLQAIRTSEVRARVDGIVERRLYTEGPTSAPASRCSRSTRALRAQVSAAAAALARAEATAPTRSRTSALQGTRRAAGAQPAGVRRRRARLRTAQADVARARPARRGATQPGATPPSPRRSPAAPAAPRSPKARSVSGGRRHSSPASSSSIRSTRTSRSRAPLSSICAARSPSGARRDGSPAPPCTSCSRTARSTASSDASTSSTWHRLGDGTAAMRATSPTRSASSCPASSCACASTPACGRMACAFRSAPSRHAERRHRVRRRREGHRRGRAGQARAARGRRWVID